MQKLHIQSAHKPNLEPTPASLIHMAEGFDGVGPLYGNRVNMIRQGGVLFDCLEKAIDEATRHIHLEYYTWQPDATGQKIRDALVRAATRGVEVRLLVDDVGSRSIKPSFFATLKRAGGRIERFLPLNPLNRHFALNNRNHRKIVVIDGRQGFIGGMNVGNQYAGLAKPWHDLHAEVRGQVVLSLQEVFCQDWYHSTSEDLVSREYFPLLEPSGGVHAQLLASGPADNRWRSIHTFLFAAINLARERVWIETPYFVPDQPILMALQTAALRGVDVRLLLPGRSDHPMVLFAGRSFQDELLQAGVKIYELTGTMTHAKTLTIDGHLSTIGSANMDQRSFRLNFEANLFFFAPTVAQAMEQGFLTLCAQADKVTMAQRSKLSIHRRLIESLCRVLSPLL
jgi:cardiolipin synthase